MRVSRRGLFGAGIVFALVAGMAIAGHEEVIDFATPSTVTAGQTIPSGVTVSEPMNVTFTSNPPGLVNYTAALASTSQTVNVPTNGAASAGVYTITATPTAGGTSKSVTVLLESGPIKPGGGG